MSGHEWRWWIALLGVAIVYCNDVYVYGLMSGCVTNREVKTIQERMASTLGLLYIPYAVSRC